MIMFQDILLGGTSKICANSMKQLELPDKGCAIKGLFICNGLDLEPLDLLNGLALGSCYQPSPEVGIPRAL